MPALAKLLAAAAPAAEPDADLLARFVSTRDDAAFAELVRRHGPAVYGTCRRLVGPSAADDAFQATFLVLAARAGSVRKAASVGSWLVGVAGRVGRRMRGREDRRQKTEDRWRQTTGDLVAWSSPDHCLLSSDLCSLLADEFTRLPDRLRAAAVACLVNGHTQEQAAAALGWSARTVRRRLDQAKGLLRARLERRGVAPAAAAAAVGAAGEAAAVPAGLVRRTADGAILFLAGGGGELPAAALAHGVIGAMTTMRSTAAAAVCVAALAGLGVGWAGDTPATAPAAPAAKAEPDRIPAPAAKQPLDFYRLIDRRANFVVIAPTAAVAGPLGDEFERQRAEAARAWLGKELPKWTEPVVVQIYLHPSGDFYTGTARFREVPKAELESAVRGRLDDLLARTAPRLATQYVLTTHLGKFPPRWAEAGVARFSDSEAEQARAVREARRQLEDGQAFRIAALFRDGSPGDAAAAQAFSVVRFLLTRAPLRVAPILPAGVGGVTLTELEPMSGRQTFTRFLRRGQEAGWETAAREVYGFDSLAQLEAEWVRWVRHEPFPPAARPIDPDRIPPPAADPPAAPEPTATHHTKNFAVTAPSAAVAQAVADAAEQHRRALAKRWLGAELPDAAEPVPVTVRITMEGSGGATSFTFGEADGKRPPGVRTAAMELRGPLDAVLKSVLPHEVMHVVLATHFGRPLPRWADEGIAVLAESDAEQRNQDVRARELLNAGRAIRLGTLFRMTEYPQDFAVMFAQGYSVCRFLLEKGAADPQPGGPPDVRGHKTVRYPGGPTGTHEVRFARGDREPALLAFLALGMGENSAESWARAAREVYGFESLDALEQAWIDWLRAPPAGRAGGEGR